MRTRVAILLVGVMGLAGAACDLGPFRTYEVSIRTSGTLHRTATSVADQVVELIHANEASLGRTLAPIRIIRVTAIDSNRATEVEPGAGVDSQHSIPVWIVRAEGTFTSNRPINGPLFAESGYFIISDAEGTVISFGFP